MKSQVQILELEEDPLVQLIVPWLTLICKTAKTCLTLTIPTLSFRNFIDKYNRVSLIKVVCLCNLNVSIKKTERIISCTGTHTAWFPVVINWILG